MKSTQLFRRNRYTPSFPGGRRGGVRTAALAAGLVLGMSAEAMPLALGEIVVVDPAATGQIPGTPPGGLLFRINPDTGARSAPTAFGLCPPPRGAFPEGVAIEESGTVLVIDSFAGTEERGVLYRVNPVFSSCEVLSDFGVGSLLGIDPQGVTVEDFGTILVVDDDAGTNSRGALFRVDPVSGARTLVTDFGIGSPLGIDPSGVAVEDSGNILVVDPSAGTNFAGALFRVDPLSGARTLVTDFGAGGPLGVSPLGVAVEDSGNILVVDRSAGTGRAGALFRVDPVSGNRTLVTEFGVGGPLGVNPSGVAVEDSGNILVVDRNAGTNGNGALFRVNPVSGNRTLVTDFGAGNPVGPAPRAVAVRRGARVCRRIGDNSGSALDADQYRFQGQAGATVEVILVPNFAGFPTGERATLTLAESIPGATLTFISNGTLPLSLRTQIPATGTYRITVSEKSPASTVVPFQGDYCLRMLHPGVPPLTPAANVEP